MRRFTVKLDATPVSIEGDSDYWVFTHPDFPDILITASTPESLSEFLGHVILEAVPNLSMEGITVLRGKRGGRSLPRVSSSDDDTPGDRGA